MRLSIIMIVFFICSLVSCRKFVDVGPPTTNLVAQTVFRNEATATAAMLAVYASMESDGLSYNAIYQSGLSADEMINYDLGNYQTDLATNNLTADNPIIEGNWLRMYKYIYQANAILAGLEMSTGIREEIKLQLTGEAKFVRAFCHFYLTSLFGAVPIAITPDYRVNIKLERQLTSEVYSLIDEDLHQAVKFLHADYLNGNNVSSAERVRPNRSAAKALLARLKLYEKKWQEAEMWASEVISSAHYELLSDLNTVFLKNSKEAIWQWQNVIPGYNTYAAVQLILLATPSVVSLDSQFVKQFSSDDKRRINWIDTLVSGNAYFLYPVKYKVGYNSPTVTEYSMVLRLSEQYLIRAEAFAQQGKLLQAEADLNTIRNRAGLASLSNLTREAILDSLQQERRFELFAEFGDRWHELKRTGRATHVLSAIKGSNWVQSDSLYPIPLAELQKNPLLTQNDGY